MGHQEFRILAQQIVNRLGQGKSSKDEYVQTFNKEMFSIDQGASLQKKCNFKVFASSWSRLNYLTITPVRVKLRKGY